MSKEHIDQWLSAVGSIRVALVKEGLKPDDRQIEDAIETAWEEWHDMPGMGATNFLRGLDFYPEPLITDYIITKRTK